MFHVSAYHTSATGALTLGDIAAVTDGWLTVQNNHFIYPRDLNLIAAAALSVNGTRAQMNTPHWRFVSQPEITPIFNAWSDDTAFGMPILNPPWLTIPRIDEVQFLGSQGAAATGGYSAFVWASDGNMNRPQGPIYPTRATASIAGATGTWARGNITFDQSLPAGWYSVVGMDVIGAAAQVARLRFQDYTMLPGVPVRSGVTGYVRTEWRYGGMGELGRFNNTAQPTMEVFSQDGGAATQTIILDLVKVSGPTI